MVLVKNWTFFPRFFRQYRPNKCVLRYSRKKKRPSRLIKSYKSRKIEIFPKGLVHGFGQKLAMFSIFLFSAIQGRKICLTIF